MRKLGSVVAHLARARRAMEAASTAANSNPRLDEMTGFGSNPGKLVARTFIPDTGRARMPLVVVLHGCTQNAGLYDRGSGWSELAESEGFALLYPEQQRTNNSNLCFNWYQPSDARRGGGEAASIAQMVGHMVERHGIDPSRVYVKGLSAGGAMTSVMLATYPELFAGGAVIAGLPFASARTLPEALERMRGQGAPSRQTLASRARAAADHSGPVPTLSVWHGTQDSIVHPGNAGELVGQWLDLHGVGSSAGTAEKIGRHRREVWHDASGRAVVERYDISGMGHGTPLATGGADSVGATGPHMLEAGISSTRRIAEFWGLSDPVRESSVHETKAAPAPVRADPFGTNQATDMIEDALRAAGLMR